VRDKTTSLIPEIISTTITKNEQKAVLLTLLANQQDMLYKISTGISHPDFEENFRLIRGKMYEVMKLVIEKVSTKFYKGKYGHKPLKCNNEPGLKRHQKEKNVAKALNITDINCPDLKVGAIENQAVTGL
jgi:hypothetical protein